MKKPVAVDLAIPDKRTLWSRIRTVGLTIHYSLKSDVAEPEQARQLVEQLRQAALDVALTEVGDVADFSGNDCNFETTQDDSVRWLLVQARRMLVVGEAHRFVVPTRIFAFTTWPGEGCEVANFGLACYPDTFEGSEGLLNTRLSGWSWQSFCKTQYASGPNSGGMANFVRCHVAVVRLLDHANAMGILEAVNDESHFWENRDVKALVETVGQWNSQIAALVGRYKDQIGGEIVAPITDYPDFEHLEAEGRRGERPDDRPAK